MTDQRDPVEELLDLTFYAPLGLALLVRDHLPELADKGRKEFEARVPLARLVGQVALDKGAAEARRRLEGLPEALLDLVADLIARAGNDDASDRNDDTGQTRSDPAPKAATVPKPNKTTGHGQSAGARGSRARLASAPSPSPSPSPSSSPSAAAGAGAGAASLPIPGYDTLSASQVVQRLSGLSTAELEAVRSYETSRRGRKIVLLKVDQLRAAS